MKVLLEAGTRAWIETRLNGLVAITLAEETTTEVEPCGRYWYRPEGKIANFPAAHPPLLINEIHLSKDMA